ncbi:MAG TPA: TIGR00159 family protein [Tissierellia bacterium]|nr:TIGR00159 family protein [Tissierellia bacterium]
MNYIITVLKIIRITDIIDILIVAYLFYKIYGLISYTRAIQLLKGIGALLIFWQLSEYVGLTMVHFMLRNILSFGALALVIIFHPELRRALEYLGRNKLISRSFFIPEQKKHQESISEILIATEELSNSKTGALMVLEGETGLNDIIDTGTVIDSQVKSSLIQNIFFPKSPLHDGATIIREDRIIAAGCLLPLSSDRSVSRELGTRHRAALGMSSNSDALIIVVSEETGVISVAHNNELERYISLTRLKNMMEEFYSDEDKRFTRMLKGVKDEEVH